jgi:hypothetical protein
MSIDRSDIGAVVDAMYACISGPAGPRDWATQREIFHDESRQARTGLDAAGRPTMIVMGREEYEANVTPFFAANGFFEVEISRRIEIFGNMAHVWSVYEARTDPSDAEPERRGINSIQLARDPDGLWSILHMIWDNERPGLTVPA